MLASIPSVPLLVPNGPAFGHFVAVLLSRCVSWWSSQLPKVPCCAGKPFEAAAAAAKGQADVGGRAADCTAAC